MADELHPHPGAIRSLPLRRCLPPTPNQPPIRSALPSNRVSGLACCQCNRSGICKGCSCVKAGKTCISCLPGRLERCRNHTRPPTPSPSSDPLPVDRGRYPHTQSTPFDALPSLESILSVQTPTLHHVPKGLRDAWASALGEVIASLVASPHQMDTWCKLFMLPRCLLFSPPQGGSSHWRDTLKTVRARIQKWQEGNLIELWEEVFSVDRKLKARRSRPKPSGSLHFSGNAIRARRAVSDGQYRKALQSLSSAGLAQPSNEVLAEMLAKHPFSTHLSLPEDVPPPPIQFSSEEVVRALKSFPSGSAPGPSSLRANHLKQAVF